MTASRKLLQTASVALLLFFGKEKQKAFEKFNTPIKVEDCPVKLVQVIPDVHIFRSLD
jgi:6-phosphogluconolactonase/glucosamine-6-phosphate isomerase/deaminase